jgi:hypothetical protein
MEIIVTVVSKEPKVHSIRYNCVIIRDDKEIPFSFYWPKSLGPLPPILKIEQG